MGKGLEHTLFQGGHIDSQQIYEKMLDITTYKGNAKQNHMQYHLKLVRMAISNKTRNYKCWGRILIKGNPCPQLVGM